MRLIRQRTRTRICGESEENSKNVSCPIGILCDGFFFCCAAVFFAERRFAANRSCAAEELCLMWLVGSELRDSGGISKGAKGSCILLHYERSC